MEYRGFWTAAIRSAWIVASTDLAQRGGFSSGGFARLLGGGDLIRVDCGLCESGSGNSAPAGILLWRIRRTFAGLLIGVDRRSAWGIWLWQGFGFGCNDSDVRGGKCVPLLFILFQDRTGADDAYLWVHCFVLILRRCIVLWFVLACFVAYIHSDSFVNYYRCT